MFAKCTLLFLSFSASVYALASPYGHHNALAARLAYDQTPSNALVRRQFKLSKRCQPRGSYSSQVPVSTSASTPAPTSSYVAPAYTPPPAAAPAPDPAPAPAPPPTPDQQNGPSYMYGTQSGQGTFYAIGLGACGVYSSGDDHIVALSKLLFDTYPGYAGDNPNNNPVCGRSITATHNGQSTTVTVTDRCEKCAITDLDLAPAAYNEIADPAAGRVDITWNWS